jgi:hypothetical protein
VSHEEYELGKRLGEAIRLLVEVIAILEGRSTQDVADELVGHHVAGRIVGEAEDGRRTCAPE